MNDLDQIAATLAKPGPSPKTVAEGRGRLARETRGSRRVNWMSTIRVRSRIFAWTAGAVTVGAAAAAILVTLTSLGATKAADLSARPVLLAAASTAESAPPATGKYWQFATDSVSTGRVNGKDMKPWRGSSALWVARDGRYWLAEGTGGKPVRGERTWRVNLCNKDVGFSGIERLPTTPAALRAEVATAIKNDGPVAAEYLDGFVTTCMIELLSTVPAPAKVRAAAFRSLAEMPRLEELGARTDHLGRSGQALSITNGITKTVLIVDPSTATVLEAHRTTTGPKALDNLVTVRASGWTDTLG